MTVLLGLWSWPAPEITVMVKMMVFVPWAGMRWLRTAVLLGCSGGMVCTWVLRRSAVM